jgi:competence protein ComEC
LPVGLAACALAPVAPLARLSSLLLDLAGLGAGAMAHLVRAIAARSPEGRVPAPTWLEALLYYGALAALAAGGRRGRRAALALLLVCAAACGARALAPRLAPRVTLTFLDVGQGDACLVELPGATLLVDGGGSFREQFDPGAQVLVPWLERRGVRRLDAVVLTHPHPDHANGLAAVVDALAVGEVWTNGAPSSLPGLERLAAAAHRRGAPIVRPHRLQAGGALVEVLHPLVDGEVRALDGWSENDGSIVLRVSYAGRAALLAGDVEARAEQRLVATSAPLAADVLKAPHHGSATSSTPAFVRAVHPSLVVFSVGASNRWGFPAATVDARWRAAGARTYRTDRDGAVTVTVDARGRVAAATVR